MIDSITASGHYFNLTLPAGGWPPNPPAAPAPLNEVERYVKPPIFTSLYYPAGVVDPTWAFPRLTLLGEQWLTYLWWSGHP